MLSLVLRWSGAQRWLLSFPTRRSSDLRGWGPVRGCRGEAPTANAGEAGAPLPKRALVARRDGRIADAVAWKRDRKSTRLNSSHLVISYAVFCLKKKNSMKRFIENE